MQGSCGPEEGVQGGISMKYIVEVQEILIKSVEVDAADDESAVDMVRQMYNRGEIVLTSDDFFTKSFEVVS